MGKKALILSSLLLFSLLLSPSQKDDWEFAESLFVRGMYKLALEEYLKYWNNYPQEREKGLLLLRIGECYFQIKEWQKAKEYFLKTAKLEEFSPQSIYRLAEISLIEGKTKEAKNLLDKLNPEELSTTLREGYLALRARIALKEKDGLRARMWKDKLREKYPGSKLLPYIGYELGRLFVEKGDREKAMECWREALSISPPSLQAELLYSLGKISLELERWEEAEESFKELLEKYPTTPYFDQAKLGEAISLFHLGRLRQSLKILDSLPSKEGLIDAVNFWKGKVLIALGEEEEGVGKLLEVSAKSSLFEDARVLAGENLWKIGKKERAIEVLKEVGKLKGRYSSRILFLLADYLSKAGKEKEAIHLLSPLSIYAGSLYYPHLLYLKASLLFQKGKYEEVLSLYEEFKKFSRKEKELTTSFLFLRAQSNFYLSRLKEAEKDFQNLYKTDKKGEWGEKSLFFLIKIYHKLGKEKKAIECVEEFQRYFPSSDLLPEIILTGGVISREMRDKEKAVSYFHYFLKKFPSHPLAGKCYYFLSQVYFMEEEKEKCASTLLQLLEKYPEFPLKEETLRWLGEYLIEERRFRYAYKVYDLLEKKTNSFKTKEEVQVEKGRIEILSGKIEKGLERLNNFLKNYPSSPYLFHAYYYLGEGYFLKGDIQKALDCWEKASEGENIADKALFRMGEYWYSCGKYGKAYRYYLKLAYLFEDSPLIPKALYRAGDSLRRLGKMEEAKKIWEELLYRFPSSEEAKEVRSIER
ncbi:tetratricopeptide repeat protein [Candidatus Calescamantes bacterium]|nr:tetratricopeptide repeat protein [Candidatus Calescamantes bacterium]